MKIYVSKDSFKDHPGFEEPMANAGICDVADGLSLGEIIIEVCEKKYLITLTPGKYEPTVKELK